MQTDIDTQKDRWRQIDRQIYINRYNSIPFSNFAGSNSGSGGGEASRAGCLTAEVLILFNYLRGQVIFHLDF